MVSYTSFYEILGIPESAVLEEIKSAFRKLALKYHPDKNANSPGSEAAFRLIYNAYSILSDSAKKLEYDAYLNTSGVLKNRRRAKVSAALPGKTADFSRPEKIFNHLNFLLWEIEDFLRRHIKADWDREYGGVPLRDYVLKILAFIDKWVLYPAGFPDYFLKARETGGPVGPESLYQMSFGAGKREHRPYTGMTDYFYNIRKRADVFLRKTRAADLIKENPESGVRLMDGIFEAQSMALHYLYYLNRVLADGSGDVPPFRHAAPFI